MTDESTLNVKYEKLCKLAFCVLLLDTFTSKLQKTAESGHLFLWSVVGKHIDSIKIFCVHNFFECESCMVLGDIQQSFIVLKCGFTKDIKCVLV